VTLDLIVERLWLPLKGISIEKTYIGKLSCTIPINDTAVTKIGDFIVDFLREFEATFKKALTRVSGA
jgi:hypothetical protein